MVKRESANGVRISNWSSDVCSYDLAPKKRGHGNASSSSEKKSVAVGLVVTKPAIPPSTRRRRPKQDEPRMNALGEIMASRVAKSERRRLQSTGESNDELAPLEGSQEIGRAHV